MTTPPRRTKRKVTMGWAIRGVEDSLYCVRRDRSSTEYIGVDRDRIVEVEIREVTPQRKGKADRWTWAT